MHLQTTFELSMVLDCEKFHRVLTKSNYLEENEEGYFDQSLASKGIIITYRESQYKKKVKLLVNSNLLLDEEASSDKKICKLEKYINKYFNATYGIDDFTLSGMVFSTDIDVGSRVSVKHSAKKTATLNQIKVAVIKDAGKKDSKNTGSLRSPLDAR